LLTAETCGSSIVVFKLPNDAGHFLGSSSSMHDENVLPRSENASKSSLIQLSTRLATSAQEPKILISWISSDRCRFYGVPDQHHQKTSQKRHAWTTKSHFFVGAACT
jgi:hypothetical protein